MKTKLIKDLDFKEYEIHLKKGDVLNIVKSQHHNEYIAANDDGEICSLIELIIDGYIKQTKGMNKFLPKGFHI